MERLSIAKDGLEACVEKAAEVLRRGGVIVYPTDTLYGLGADAFSDAGFAAVCAIKERDERRPIHAIFADMHMIEAYAEMTPAAKKLADRFLPGALTLVLAKKPHVEGGIARDLPTIGVRIPKHDFCLQLAAAFGKPFTTTSANKSGEPAAAALQGVLRDLGKDATKIDLAIDGGTLSSDLRSTVVDVRSEEPYILREGVISSEAIEEALLA
ncbi:MAG: threonylcarbamoyl-AMP synthase [Candidatus Kaiserbacteria bacterium]|nr:MAG: threonylcarbamoyl-AMP synthase [Candidatus Kaiserbacteria bacterium]